MKLARKLYIQAAITFFLGEIALFYLIRIENKRLLHELGSLSTSRVAVGYEAMIAGHYRVLFFGGFIILVLTSVASLLALRRWFSVPLGHMAKDLGDSTLKYRTLVETSSDAIVLVDAQSMRVREINRAATLLTGYSREELLGLVSDDLHGPEEAGERYRAFFKRWAFDGKGYLHEGSISKKNKGIVSVEVSAATVELGGSVFMLEIWRDISDRKCLEDNLRTQIEALEARVRERTEELSDALERLKISRQKMIQSTKLISLGEMGAGIAHELNSPLAGILTIAEVLLGRMDKSDRSYALIVKLKDAALRSKYIIIDMLSYARPFKGEREPLDMNDVLRSTLSLFTSEINSASVEIRLDLTKNLPMVLGARGQLMEVMFNIIKNARDVLGGYGKISLSTSAREEAGAAGVAVDISDTGPGISSEVLDKIFDPFFSTKDKGGGLNIGLGLSISQSIIKEHGGVISARNLEKGGASFRVFIPAIADVPEKQTISVNLPEVKKQD